MMVLAYILSEYQTPEIFELINDIGGVAIAAAAVAGIITGIAKLGVWVDHRREDRFAAKVREVVEPIIKEATKPIQPDTNGGKSLSDLHSRLNGYDGRFDAIEARLGIKERRGPDEIVDL